MAFGAELVGGLRERVLTAVDGGLPSKTVAARSGVSLLFFDKVLKRRRVSGETTARAQRNQQEFKLAVYHEATQAEVVARPDATLVRCVLDCSKRMASRRASG